MRAIKRLSSSVVLLWATGIVCMPRAQAGDDAVNRYLFNIKAGASFPVSGSELRGFAFELDGGYAVSTDGRAKILFSPGLQIGVERIIVADTSFLHTVIEVMVPIGFQYDIPLPVRGLYLYPRFTVGYTAAISRTEATAMAAGDTSLFHRGVFNPAVGIKYVIGHRYNVGIEPANVAVFFNANGSAVSYRMLAYVGLEFGNSETRRAPIQLEAPPPKMVVGPQPASNRFEGFAIQRSRIPDDGQTGKQRPIVIEPERDKTVPGDQVAVGAAIAGGSFFLHEPAVTELTTPRTSLAPDPADPAKLVELQKDELDGRVRLSGVHRVPELGVAVKLRLTVDCNARPATFTVEATGGGSMAQVLELPAGECARLREFLLKIEGASH